MSIQCSTGYQPASTLPNPISWINLYTSWRPQKLTLNSTAMIIDKRSIDPAGLNPVHSVFLLIINKRDSNVIQRLLPELASPRLYLVVNLWPDKGLRDARVAEADGAAVYSVVRVAKAEGVAVYPCVTLASVDTCKSSAIRFDDAL